MARSKRPRGGGKSRVAVRILSLTGEERAAFVEELLHKGVGKAFLAKSLGTEWKSVRAELRDCYRNRESLLIGEVEYVRTLIREFGGRDPRECRLCGAGMRTR